MYYFVEKGIDKHITMCYNANVIKRNAELPKAAESNNMKELTILQKAIMTAIKAHNASDENEYLTEYNNGIKFLSMKPRTGRGTPPHGETYHEWNTDYSECKKIDDVYISLLVKCKFRPSRKYDNIVMYQVLIISSGEMDIYFDGTEYGGK